MVAYTPVDSEDESVREQFWNELNEVVSACDSGERIILLEGLNGWVDKQRDRTEIMLGKLGDDRVKEN